jgi:predicted phosphodiesterase
MRLAVLSDIHGNLRALEVVLADIEVSGGADLIWCLGDLAMGGPQPAECVRRVRALAELTAIEGEDDEAKTKTCDSETFKVIGGNTERYLVNGERLRTPTAKDEAAFAALSSAWAQRDAVINWGVSQLSWDDYQYLARIRGRELAHEVAGFGWVIGYHAVPGNDETMLTPETPDEEAVDFLLDREGRLAIGGHTHRQMHRAIGDWQIVNVGSVGLTFDGHAQAQYGLFTFADGEVTVELRNLAYDLDALRADFAASGHPAPDWFMSRLLAPAPAVTPAPEADHAEAR